MRDRSMKPELKQWVVQRINILSQIGVSKSAPCVGIINQSALV